MSDVALPSALAPVLTSTGVDFGTRLWRAVTAPFWVWSDVPAPDLPIRETATPDDLGLAGEVFLSG
ncbi:MAG: hypothetical protein ACR2J8_07675, partial [Thermomicrobiales bacterium]